MWGLRMAAGSEGMKNEGGDDGRDGGWRMAVGTGDVDEGRVTAES